MLSLKGMAPTRNKVDVDVKVELAGHNAGVLCAADKVQAELLAEPCIRTASIDSST